MIAAPRALKFSWLDPGSDKQENKTAFKYWLLSHEANFHTVLLLYLGRYFKIAHVGVQKNE